MILKIILYNYRNFRILEDIRSQDIQDTHRALVTLLKHLFCIVYGLIINHASLHK